MDQVTSPSNSPQPKKSSAGLIIIILIIVLAVIGAGAYFLFSKGSKTVSQVVSKVAPLNPNCKHNDPDLCKFLNNWQTIEYFTANSTSTFEGKEQKSVIKSVGDDKYQMTNISGGTENFNVISIGNATYTKDYTDGKWLKTVTQTSNSQVEESKNEFKFDVNEDQTQYKKIGTEACGKLTCFKYQVVDPALSDINSTEYILFDNKEYMLRKTITLGPDNNQAISEFEYSKISISEPSPIKESPSSNIPSTSSGAPSSPSNSSAGTSSQELEQAIQEAESQLNNLGVDAGDISGDTEE